MTRSGIEYELEISPYFTTIKYEDIELTYHFSSEKYLDKFKNDIELSMSRNKLHAYLSIRYNINIYYDLLADILLYSKIEKRGFYILSNIKEEGIKCLDQITLNGVNLILSD